MPQPVNHGNNLRRQNLTRQLSTTSINGEQFLSNRQKANVKKWISRWRRNWDLFAEEYLRIKLYPLQKFSLHMIGISQEYNEIATRGAAKSWRIALAAICAFCLYPYSGQFFHPAHAVLKENQDGSNCRPPDSSGGTPHSGHYPYDLRTEAPSQRLAPAAFCPSPQLPQKATHEGVPALANNAPKILFVTCVLKYYPTFILPLARGWR